jgi:hypothetical protein
VHILRASVLLLGVSSFTLATLLLLLLDHTLLHRAAARGTVIGMDLLVTEHQVELHYPLVIIQVVDLELLQGLLSAMVSPCTLADLVLQTQRITTSSSSSSSMVPGLSAHRTACRCRILRRWLISRAIGSTRHRLMRHRCGPGVPVAVVWLVPVAAATLQQHRWQQLAAAAAAVGGCLAGERMQRVTVGRGTGMMQ